jgi:hypothetical protein
MDVSILELFSNSPSCLTWTSGLQGNDFNEVWNTTEILLFIRLGGKVLNRNGNGRERLLLLYCQ